MASHLWQSTLFTLAVWLLTILLRKNSAQLRYGLWLSASLKFLIPFALLIHLGRYLDFAPAAVHVASPAVSRTLVQITQPFPNIVAVTPASPTLMDKASALVSILWACGFAVIMFLRWRDWLRIRAAMRASSPLPAFTDIRVLLSPGLLEPGAFGWFQPAVLLPDGILERLNTLELFAILAHEFCHIQRRDNLTALIHMLVEAVFWFYPLVWWIGARLLEEREQACDEAVLQSGSNPHVYAQAILNVCKYYLESPVACVPGVSGADLKKRLHRILAQHITQNLTLPKKALIAAAALSTLLAPIGVGLINRAQSADNSLEFEVASIRKNNDPLARIIGYTVSGTRVTGENITLKNLIYFAYNFKDYQISGGPKWADSERWNIAARAEGDHELHQEQVRIMTQKLLADRFQLKFHREMRTMPVYFLVQGKGGAKLKESASDAPGGLILNGNGTIKITTKKGDIGQLVNQLSGNLGRPVIDKTDLTGTYDYKLEWAPDGPDSATLDVPSIFTAIQQQLGLKLEPTKAPIEVLIIDSAQLPSEN